MAIMSEKDLKDLKARYDQAENYKNRWLALYQDLYRYVIPDRNAFNIKWNYRDDGIPLTNQVWDDTAVIAAYQRANDLQGLLLPQDRIWGKLILDPHDYDQELIDTSQEMMDEINERIFYYINQSNLARVVSSSNLDLIGGTAAIYVESISDNIPLYFRSIPAVALYIEYTTDDLLNTCWYQNRMSARQIVKSFPDYKGKMLTVLNSLPDEEYNVIYGQIRLSEEKFYIYAIMEDDPDHVLFEHIKPYNQIIIYRDRVRPGESDGRGVGLDLLPTIKDLNRLVEMARKSFAYKANPPIFYDAGNNYFNPFSLRNMSGALIARQPNGRNPLEAFEMPEYQSVLEEIQDLRNVIQQAFQVDPLGEINSPVKSATEVSIRENRAQRTSATNISRLINELPRQIYDVSSKILNERSLLVKDKKNIPGFSVNKLRFDFQSPLYDIQNQQDINNLVSDLQILQQFFGQGATFAALDLFETNEFLIKKFNLPRKLFASDAQLRSFLQKFSSAVQNQSQPQPNPTTSATPVSLPQYQGVSI